MRKPLTSLLGLCAALLLGCAFFALPGRASATEQNPAGTSKLGIPVQMSSTASSGTITPTQASSQPTSSVFNTKDRGHRLRQLLILYELFRHNSEGVLNPNGPTIGDIAILDEIFKESYWFHGRSGTDSSKARPGTEGLLSALLASKHLFRHDSHLSRNQNTASLGDIIFLKNLLALPSPRSLVE